mmetsp:Transcript_25458/g.57849  ORF Transcript_25458/g.57849 Transcript_25458/m.57849 type:complete len:101 (-) Transcript_25458:21-323(-)
MYAFCGRLVYASMGGFALAATLAAKAASCKELLPSTQADNCQDTPTNAAKRSERKVEEPTREDVLFARCHAMPSTSHLQLPRQEGRSETERRVGCALQSS